MDKAPTELLLAAAAKPAGVALPADQTAAIKRAFLAQWIILGFALLILGGIIANTLHEERKYIESIAQDRLSLGAKSIAFLVDRRLTSIDRALLDLRKKLPELRAQRNGETLVSISLQTIDNIVDGVRTALVIDARGTVTASSRAELVGKNFSQREYFQTLVHKPEAQTLYISAPFKTGLGVYSLNVFRATFNAGGEFSGIVSAMLEPEDFEPMLASLRYTPDVAVGLIHGSGKVLLYLASPAVAPGTDVSDPREFFSRHLQGRQEHSQLSGSVPVLPNERLAAAHTIRPAALSMNAPLVVVVSQEINSILAPWHAEVRNQSALFILLATLASLGLFFHQRRRHNVAGLTFRHQAERQHDVDRLTLATEASGIGIWELDVKSQALSWDDTMFRLYGQQRAGFSSAYAAWQASVLPADLPATEAALQHAIDHGKELATVFRIRRGDGEIRIIDALAWVYCDEAGQPARMIGVNRDITQRQLAEQAVRQSEERFSAFFEHAMVGMATTSLEKGWTLVNPALCTLLGYPRQELLGKTWSELTHPDDLAADLANFERLLRDESDHYAMEKRFIRPDGNAIHAFLAIRAVRRPDRSINFFAAIVEDISERKLAEDATNSAQRLMQQFIDQLPGTAYVKDENLRVLMANKAFQTLLGIDPETMIGKSNAELFPGNFGKQQEADDRRVLESGQITIIQEDFEGRYFELNKFVIEGEAGKRLLGGITMEVTQRQKHFERQEALLRISALGGTLSEKEFLGQGLEMVERLTRSQIGFIHLVDDEQHSIELVTWTAGALQDGSAVDDRHYPLAEAGVWADSARQQKIMVFNDYPKHGTGKGLPEGHSPLYRLISIPVIEEGQVRVILGVGNKTAEYDDYDCATAQLIVNDLWRIIRRVRAETALQQKLAELIELNARLDETNNKLLLSEKLASIGQLAAGVAHEINNPIGYVTANLNSLSGYVNDLLAIDAVYKEIEDRFGASMPQAFNRAHQLKAETDHSFIVGDIHHLLGESREGLERVRKIVQDLKDFSHLGGSGWQRANLHEGLESTLNIVWNEIKYKAEVDREYGDLPEIHCIPSQINQVFMNLLTNAAQSITAQGHIVLRSGCDGRTVWVEVQDDGAGIAPENLEHIFEPFFTTKAVGKGTGLGLSLSWGIIQRHQGRIEVRSTLGQGTTFRVILPIDPPPGSASQPETTS